MLKAIESKQGGDRGGGRPAAGEKPKGGRPPEGLTRTSAAESAGLSPHQTQEALRVASIPKRDFEKAIETEPSHARREAWHHRAMSRRQAENMLPRFMTAVTTMAGLSGHPSLQRRLAWVACEVTVFLPGDAPEELRSDYVELRALLGSGRVPEHSRFHPDTPKTAPAFYLSPKKARRAADLMTGIFTRLVTIIEITDPE